MQVQNPDEQVETNKEFYRLNIGSVEEKIQGYKKHSAKALHMEYY